MARTLLFDSFLGSIIIFQKRLRLVEIPMLSKHFLVYDITFVFQTHIIE